MQNTTTIAANLSKQLPEQPTNRSTSACKLRLEDETEKIGSSNNRKVQPESISTRSSAIAEGPRDASCQLKSCQLPRNSAETTYTTSPDQIDGIKLEI